MNFILLPYVVLFFMIFLLYIVLKRNILIVKAESSRYRRILCLNDEQEFHKIHAPCYRFSSQCNSKKKYDKLNLDEYMMYIIEHNERNITNIIKKVEENNEKYSKYCSEFGSIKSELTDKQLQEYKMTRRGFRRIEERVCNNVKLQPRLNIQILLSAKYISPKGKNAYEKHKNYSYEKVREMYLKTKEMADAKENFEKQKKLERLKMTDSLRYDILKRDGYKCQICGVTAKEGAKLHVDHIKPIAKGGKTVPENLQTLCDRCNLGKSDKYDEKEWNNSCKIIID